MLGFGYCLMVSWLFCFLWFMASVSLTGSYTEDKPLNCSPTSSVCYLFSKQESARTEYKRLKKEMMETKRNRDKEGKKHSGIEN